jgi:hypothetical protein
LTLLGVAAVDALVLLVLSVNWSLPAVAVLPETTVATPELLIATSPLNEVAVGTFKAFPSKTAPAGTLASLL